MYPEPFLRNYSVSRLAVEDPPRHTNPFILSLSLTLVLKQLGAVAETRAYRTLILVLSPVPTLLAIIRLLPLTQTAWTVEVILLLRDPATLTMFFPSLGALTTLATPVVLVIGRHPLPVARAPRPKPPHLSTPYWLELLATD